MFPAYAGMIVGGHGLLHSVVVFPAYAGMIRIGPGRRDGPRSVPRLRGDDPTHRIDVH